MVVHWHRLAVVGGVSLGMAFRIAGIETWLKSTSGEQRMLQQSIIFMIKSFMASLFLLQMVPDVELCSRT